MSVQNSKELLQSIKLGETSDGVPVTAWDVLDAFTDVMDDMGDAGRVEQHTGLPEEDCERIVAVYEVVMKAWNAMR